MKDLLLVDWDGTLCFDRFWQDIEPSTYQQIQELLFSKQNSKISDWMRGQHTSEEINQFIAQSLGVSYDHLWDNFVRGCKSMKVSLNVLMTIYTLRARFQTILLTDNMDSFTRFTVPALELSKYFDAILNSADHGRLKSDNEGELFEILAKEKGVPIKKSMADR